MVNTFLMVTLILTAPVSPLQPSIAAKERSPECSSNSLRGQCLVMGVGIGVDQVTKRFPR